MAILGNLFRNNKDSSNGEATSANGNGSSNGNAAQAASSRQIGLPDKEADTPQRTNEQVREQAVHQAQQFALQRGIGGEALQNLEFSVGNAGVANGGVVNNNMMADYASKVSGVPADILAKAVNAVRPAAGVMSGRLDATYLKLTNQDNQLALGGRC